MDPATGVGRLVQFAYVVARSDNEIPGANTAERVTDLGRSVIRSA